VLFAMPRCVLRVAASSSGDSRHTVGASVSSPHPALYDDPATVATLLARARSAAALAATLPDAPAHPAGSFPLVIDYALAKGLAHEAFGHASEADGFRSSILARDGRFRRVTSSAPRTCRSWTSRNPAITRGSRTPRRGKNGCARRSSTAAAWPTRSPIHGPSRDPGPASPTRIARSRSDRLPCRG